jgi:uncharacterized membrane protein
MEYEITVPIRAPAATVWRLLVDVERWPELTPSIDSVERRDAGEMRVGSEADVKQPKLRKATWRVTTLDPERNFTWASRSLGLTTEGSHVIEPAPDGVNLRLRIRQTGVLAPVAALFFGSIGKRYVQQEGEGFRREAEAVTR